MDLSMIPSVLEMGGGGGEQDRNNRFGSSSTRINVNRKATEINVICILVYITSFNIATIKKWDFKRDANNPGETHSHSHVSVKMCFTSREGSSLGYIG